MHEVPVKQMGKYRKTFNVRIINNNHNNMSYCDCDWWFTHWSVSIKTLRTHFNIAKGYIQPFPRYSTLTLWNAIRTVEDELN